MKYDDFDKLVDYIFNRIKTVMCSKSEEYATGEDKLHNFYRSAEMDGISPIEALRGMDLKHRTSISDMLDELETKEYSQERWEEKTLDHINYMILMYALLYERYGWSHD